MIPRIRTLSIASDRKPKLNPITQKGMLLVHITENSWVNLASFVAWFRVSNNATRHDASPDLGSTLIPVGCQNDMISGFGLQENGHAFLPAILQNSLHFMDSGWATHLSLSQSLWPREWKVLIGRALLTCQLLVREEVNLIQNLELSLKKNVILQGNKEVYTPEEHWKILSSWFCC